MSTKVISEDDVDLLVATATDASRLGKLIHISYDKIEKTDIEAVHKINDSLQFQNLFHSKKWLKLKFSFGRNLRLRSKV